MVTTQERLEEASRQFAETLREAWTPGDIQERGTRAYAEYIEAMQHAWSGDVYQRVADAYANYMRVVHEALDRRELRDRATEAFRTYLRALRDGWTGADIDQITAAGLATIAQGMLATAYMAGSALPNAVEWTAPTPTAAGQSA